MAASEWCQVALGTPSINLINLGANWGIQNLNLTTWAHCQSLNGIFADFQRWVDTEHKE
jgi:hypothetical protein